MSIKNIDKTKKQKKICDANSSSRKARVAMIK